MIEVLLGMIFFVLLCNTVGVWGSKNKIRIVDGRKKKKKKHKNGDKRILSEWLDPIDGEEDL